MTGTSPTEEEEDFPPPPPDISGLHIGENVSMNHVSNTETFPFSQREEQVI